ncbi:hypothetical protein N7462_006798 [Penicillium macrosclerotiorum]|uniref:uncharacterized protein n=1 Tax=Penicillium macrosclerotiorum TaxID=303699 RepID=UPI0025491540|nr:uncharacterized protein N7462_006798 [Penicillium macrosclerotiorum]KAJ5683633.1 hypothetical protein N7462_006798 [Penicillium macrosclerotiorum]
MDTYKFDIPLVPDECVPRYCVYFVNVLLEHRHSALNDHELLNSIQDVLDTLLKSLITVTSTPEQERNRHYVSIEARGYFVTLGDIFWAAYIRLFAWKRDLPELGLPFDQLKRQYMV